MAVFFWAVKLHSRLYAKDTVKISVLALAPREMKMNAAIEVKSSLISTERHRSFDSFHGECWRVMKLPIAILLVECFFLARNALLAEYLSVTDLPGR